jgi:tetratricopeptide (TPR) repeat protein
MTWLPIGMALLLSAASALAQCRPSGRDSFAAGLEALSRGDLPAAAARFEEVVHAQPDCAEARNNFAVVLVEQGRIDEAAYQLRQALRARPDYYRARLNLDRVVALITAQRREAFGEAPLGSAEARPLAAEPAVPAAPPNIAALEPPSPPPVACASTIVQRARSSPTAAMRPWEWRCARAHAGWSPATSEDNGFAWWTSWRTNV